MLPEERKEQIIIMLNRDGNVTVKNLSEQFNVTEDCIRKDLTWLQNAGKLKKTYGGAMPVRANTHMLEVKKRKNINLEAKKKIAKKAVEIIKDNDMIFLDISTSSIEIAKLLVNSNKKITIVTNMLEIIRELSTSADIKLICIGGQLNRGQEGFYR
jgi:Transcriptional regulators of sugar metabolism